MKRTRKGLGRFASTIAACVGLFAGMAWAVEEHLVEEARKLYAEAKPLVEKANDIELDMEDRKGPRKEAYAKLRRSRDLYDQYLNMPANKSMEEKLDEEYGNVTMLIFWLKKDAALGDLGDKEEKKPEPTTPAPGTPQPPGGGPGAGPPSGPPKSETPSEFAFRAKNEFKVVQEFEKANSGDLPAIKQRYEKFAAEFSDRTLPEYAQALERIGQITDRMNNVLKEVAKRDPDTIKLVESKAEESIFGKLSQDFSAKDPEVRRRAARLLSASRSRSAPYFLAKGLTDKDAELAKICRDGLIAIGGKAVGEALVTQYRDAAKEKQEAALDVLSEVTKKSAIDAKAQSDAIGHFVLSNESDIAEKAIALLTAMGGPGGPGLMYGLDSVNPVKKIAAMEALAQAKYYKAATTIGDRYLDHKVPQALREAALKCIETMGVRAFPHLIPVMSNPWVPFAMNKLAGEQLFIRGDQKKARAWWNEHKPKEGEAP